MHKDTPGEPNKRHGKLLLVNRPLQNREKWAIIRASCAWPDPNSGRRRRSIWGENLEPRVRALRLSLPHNLLVNSGGGRVLPLPSICWIRWLYSSSFPLAASTTASARFDGRSANPRWRAILSRAPRDMPPSRQTALKYSRRSALRFVNSKNPRKQFAAGRGPTVAPPKEYVPTRSVRKPPFHAEIEAASNLADDSLEFLAFVLDVVGMPEHMAPSIAAAIRQQKWKISPNPLASIRTAAHQEARRTLSF